MPRKHGAGGYDAGDDGYGGYDDFDYDYDDDFDYGDDEPTGSRNGSRTQPPELGTGLNKGGGVEEKRETSGGVSSSASTGAVQNEGAAVGEMAMEVRGQAPILESLNTSVDLTSATKSLCLGEARGEVRGGGGGGKSELESEQWRCDTCTFDNPASFLICDVCGAERQQKDFSQTSCSTSDSVDFHSNAKEEEHVKGLPVSRLGQYICSSKSGGKKLSSWTRAMERAPCGKGEEEEKKEHDESSEAAAIAGSQQQAKIEKSGDSGPRRGRGDEGRLTSQPASLNDHGVGSVLTRGGTTAKQKSSVRGSVGMMEDDTKLPAGGGGGGGGTFKEVSNRPLPSLPLDTYVGDQSLEQMIKTKGVEDGKELLHLIVIGHVDAGKSTIMGRVLHQLGHVSQKEMHKNEREAKQQGKGSFAFAWVLDEGAEERARGVTMTVAVAHFETKDKRVVLLDAPGHKDFVPNMIAGASQADAAVLVVDATPGAFEAGFDAGFDGGGGGGGGQTREHAQLARSLGVEQLIVAVNKMDVIDYDKERFYEIKSTLGTFLKHCGFRDGAVKWVPVSAFDGENLTRSVSDDRLKEWYKGPTLLDAINAFKSPARQISKPLRLSIAEVVKSSRSLGPVAVGGKVEGGAMRLGTRVLVMPSQSLATVKVLERNGLAVAMAGAGDSVDVGLTGVDAGVLCTGGALCHPDYPIPIVHQFEARVLVLAIKVPILKGAQVVLHAHNSKESGIVCQLIAVLDPRTGAVAKQRPRCLTANQSAVVEIRIDRGVCLELYSDYRPLGRIVLRQGGTTLAVGIVTRIVS